jgi:hypothetical protein
MALRAKFGSVILSTAVLAGLGYTNWLAFTEPIDTAPLMRTAALAATAGNAVSPVIEPKQVALADLGETLTRPLFYASRRPLSKLENKPVVTAASVQAIDPVKSEVTPVPNANLRLLGILRNDESTQSVLIQSGNGSPAKWHAVGSEIDGWRVTGISADHAVVEASGTKAVLQLHSVSTPAGPAQ